MACPACGAPNPAAAKFCGGCGSPIGAGRSGSAPPATETVPVAERRLVSVLFADLVGFTTFAEGRDPEEVRETLSAYFEMAREIVERYGGTVEKFIGDAVMAVWGAPTAHEDDAERAVRAGLELAERVSAIAVGFAARVAVMTGEAAVTLGATDQGLVAGDLVNTASRLQSIAPPGTVLVGEATMRAATAVAFEPAGEQALKGKSAPVPAHRAIGPVAARGGRARAGALEPPFVGREAESCRLQELLATTAHERRARLVTITGPAGIGKSRLAAEFERATGGGVAPVRWLRGRSPSYGSGITFWALGEMVRRQAGLVEGDDEPTTRDRIAAAVDASVVDPDEHRLVESALLALLGVEPAPPGGREVLFTAWRTFLQRIVGEETLVLAFEDLQWADTGLLDFIEHLLEWSQSAPILVLALARPDLLERRPDWGAKTRELERLALAPLDDGPMHELLERFVPGLPGTAGDAIVERADGIPLYAVEMVRTLAADGTLVERDGAHRPNGEIASLTVPPTLRALVAARLDALGQGDRSLVGEAAVLGQSFAPAALAGVAGLDPEVLDARMRALVAREVFTVVTDPHSPERGQYAFVQSLVREVAYATLARRDRRRLHLAAAAYLEHLGVDELAGALAGHYLAAYRATAAGVEADALAVRARAALRAAAERAITLGSLDQAVEILDRAMEITTDTAEEAALLERAGPIAADAAGQLKAGETRLRRAVELRRGGEDRSALIGAIAELGRTLDLERPAEALAYLESAVSEFGLAEAPPHDANEVALLAALSRAAMFVADYPRSIEIGDRALTAAERLDLPGLAAGILFTKAQALAWGPGARVDEGLIALRKASELAQACGDRLLAMKANPAILLIDSDPRAAFEAAKDGLAEARRLGLRYGTQHGFTIAALPAVEIGEWDWVITEATAGIKSEPPSVDHSGWWQARLPVRLYRGEDADDDLSEVIAGAEAAGDPVIQTIADDLRAVAAFAAGRFDEAWDRWAAMGGNPADNLPVAYLFSTAMAALLGRDRDHAAATLDLCERLHPRGRLARLGETMIRAGIAALDGDRSRAIRGFRAVARGYGTAGVAWRQALTSLAAVTLLGDDDPSLRALADDARRILGRLEARPFLTLLEQATRQAVGASMAADAARGAADGGRAADGGHAAHRHPPERSPG